MIGCVQMKQIGLDHRNPNDCVCFTNALTSISSISLHSKQTLVLDSRIGRGKIRSILHHQSCRPHHFILKLSDVLDQNLSILSQSPADGRELQSQSFTSRHANRDAGGSLDEDSTMVWESFAFVMTVLEGCFRKHSADDV